MVTVKAQRDLDKLSDFKYSNRRLQLTPLAYSSKQVVVPSSEVYFRLDHDDERELSGKPAHQEFCSLVRREQLVDPPTEAMPLIWYDQCL